MSFRQPLDNARPTTNPINVMTATDAWMTSTTVGEIQHPSLKCLPKWAIEAHGFDAMGSMSLLSIGLLTDAGCIATFSANKMTLDFEGRTILTATRSNETNQLWIVDPPQTLQAHINQCLGAVNMSSKPEDMVAFAHASFCSPTIVTLKQAIQKGYIPQGIPGLTVENLSKYPPDLRATARGHLKQERKGKQSTKKHAPEPIPDKSDPNRLEAFNFPLPLHNGQQTNFVYAATIDSSNTGTAYSDQTGPFSHPSSRGNKLLFVLYDYDSNFIFAVPMKNREAASILAAYTDVYNQLKAAGMKPKLQKLDNECSNMLKEFLADEDTAIQLVPPGIHRQNAAERAIQTFKDHFIAALATTASNFPINQWDLLIPQAVLTLNLMRGSRMNNKLSAWAQIKGPYDYNAHPFAPPGIKVEIHNKPKNRTTFQAKCEPGWYMGPATEHYRCYQVFAAETRATRISDTVVFLPEKIPVPGATPAELVVAAINDLAMYAKRVPTFVSH